MWDGKDCATAGRHLQDAGEDHGFMNWPGSQSHMGDLLPFTSDPNDHISYLAGANKPSMYGSNAIFGKTMVVYEHKDDFGQYGTSDSLEWGGTGREIACCRI